MAEQGIILSQEGIDVRRAADYQKALDSRWRFLEIALEYRFTRIEFPAYQYISGSPQLHKIILFEHGMKFAPAWDSSLINYWFDPPVNQTDTINTEIDDKYVYATRSIYPSVWNGSSYNSELIPGYTYVAPTGTEDIIRLYNVNLLEEYTAPSYDISYSASSPSKIGAKFVSAKGGRIDDTDPENFSLNTSYKALQIHKSGRFFVTAADADPSNAKQGYYELEHNVGYPPTYMATKLKEVSGKFYPEPFEGRFHPYARADGRVIGFRDVQSEMSGWYGYIILKDPSEIAG